VLGRYNSQGLGDLMEQVTKEFVVPGAAAQHQQQHGEHNSLVGAHAQAQAQVHAQTGDSSVPPLQVWLRCTPGQEYIKVVVRAGKIVGALLIGDTDLEEVFENLIMSALDVGSIGIQLLDPEFDIADYFD
jgi:hypothetical protein